MKLFEVILAPGADSSSILSKETLEETGAQVFNEKEAELVGLEGLPDNPEDEPRVFVACSHADAQFVSTRLEASAAVSRYKLHEI